ncbi:MAG: HAD family hydrolase [Chloroflexi bacterium]|nr:HAD family hydrolase [Chloroflexota bacterium]
MLQGAIFDLGSTLISNEYNNNWSKLRPRMIADLTADLQAQGLALGREVFAEAFARIFADFDVQRQTHFKEITSDYILRTTLNELNIPSDGLDVPRALAAYFAFSESLWTPMPGVHEALAELASARRGLKLAIVSNAADEANVQRLIDNHSLRSYFDPIVVSAAVGVRKPNPRIFAPVLEAWQIPPGEMVVIGDTLGADTLGAKHAGMKSVWVTMEADTPYNEAHRHTIIPDAVASSLAELPDILERI